MISIKKKKLLTQEYIKMCFYSIRQNKDNYSALKKLLIDLNNDYKKLCKRENVLTRIYDWIYDIWQN